MKYYVSPSQNTISLAARARSGSESRSSGLAQKAEEFAGQSAWAKWAILPKIGWVHMTLKFELSVIDVVFAVVLRFLYYSRCRTRSSASERYCLAIQRKLS